MNGWMVGSLNGWMTEWRNDWMIEGNYADAMEDEGINYD